MRMSLMRSSNSKLLSGTGIKDFISILIVLNSVYIGGCRAEDGSVERGLVNDVVFSIIEARCESLFSKGESCSITVAELTEFEFVGMYIFEQLKYEIEKNCEKLKIPKYIKDEIRDPYCSHALFVDETNTVSGYIRGDCDTSFAAVDKFK